MTVAVDVVLPFARGLDLIPIDEWVSVCTRQHNVLLEGPEPSTQGILLLLQPYLRIPVLRVRSGEPLDFRPTHGGALVCQDVGALDRWEQAKLLEWLDGPEERRQVVSTTTYPLFPLVEGGLFDAALYYRLNIMRLCFGWNTGGA